MTLNSSPRASLHAALTGLAQLDKSDLDRALRTILTVDAESLSCGRVSFWELAPDHSTITCRVLYDRAASRFESGALLRAADFPAYFRAMLESRAIVAHDAWMDPRTNEFVEPYFRPHDIRSMLDIPVWRQGKLAGVVCHEQVGACRTWTSEEQDFGLGIGNMISVAIEAMDRRRAEEGYALIARATNDVLWDWDIASDVVEWNEALLAVFRYSAEEVQPSWEWWASRLHADDRETVRAKVAQMVASGGASWTSQYRWMRGDGTIATVMDRGLIVRDGHGTPVRMVGSMLDISDRCEMQARLALSDRMASIGTLAAGVAHEINNPLTYVMANLTCALEELRDGTTNPGLLADLLRDAHEGAERIRNIVRDLQSFSRPREHEVEDVDVRAIAESSINMAWNEVRHRAQLVKDYGETPPVRMNRARLGQVILNLLVNAAHAIPEGNVQRNRIRIRTSTASNGDAVIEIDDTGGGIPSDVIDHVFEPFFTTKPIGYGTGLGLPICHSIVTAAGGEIAIASPARGGCTVTLRLPPARELRPSIPPPVPHDAQKRRVLLIDDEAPLRRAMRRMLEPQHEVVLAECGAHALRRMREGEQFDVILCDLMMPSMTGIALYEQLVAEGSSLADRFVFMTGGAFTSVSSEFVAHCKRPVIEKPIDQRELARVFAAMA